MEQIWIPRVGPPEVLTLKSAPDPEPGPTELRIRVKASGINFADIMARLGLYPDASLPLVVGYEISGVIDKAGAEVSGFNPGDPVIGICRFGGYSDLVVLPKEQVFPMPQGMTFPEGAAIPVNYLTAYQMLFAMGRIEKGDVVFAHSLGGGVGFAVIDLCQIAGARIIGTASRHKHEALRHRGVDLCLDPKEDYVRKVREFTHGRGVNLVLDPVGGDSWQKGFSMLRPTGRLVAYGFSGAAACKKRSFPALVRNLVKVPWLSFNPLTLMSENKGILGVNLGHLWEEKEEIRGWALQILKWCEQGKIHPTVDKTFLFAEASAAHHYIQDRKNLGKVILAPAHA